MPSPTSAPVIPPAVAPAAAPPSAARIGPAAMNAPSPGIAIVPTPASSPRTPPSAPPAAAPVAAPSGIFVLFSVDTRSPSGIRIEMSPFENPDSWSSSKICAAWSSLFTMPTTALPLPAMIRFLRLRIEWLLFRCDLELILDLAGARDLHRLRGDRVALFRALHGAAQRDHAVDGDDLDVVRGRGER